MPGLETLKGIFDNLKEHNNDGTHKAGKLQAYQHTPVSVTNTTLETTLASFIIPGGTMGLNGILQYAAAFGRPSSGQSASTTLRARLGGISGPIIWTYSATTVALSAASKRTLHNRNSESSQVARGVNTIMDGTNTVANSTFSINTTVAQNLVFTAQLGNSADSATLDYAYVEILK